MYNNEINNYSYENYNDDSYTAKPLISKMDFEPEIRNDKVQLARERLKAGYYHKKNVLSQIVDKILKEFGLD